MGTYIFDVFTGKSNHLGILSLNELQKIIQSTFSKQPNLEKTLPLPEISNLKLTKQAFLKFDSKSRRLYNITFLPRSGKLVRLSPATISTKE
jgi:hypothetical protein